jgi:hypothetical protein
LVARAGEDFPVLEVGVGLNGADQIGDDVLLIWPDTIDPIDE